MTDTEKGEPVFEIEGNLDQQIKDQYYYDVFKRCISLYKGSSSPEGYFFGAVFGDFEGYEMYIYQKWNEKIAVQKDLYLSSETFMHFTQKFKAEIEVATQLFKEVAHPSNGLVVLSAEQNQVIDSFKEKINPRFTLFDVDSGFQRIDMKDFTQKNDRKWFTALRLTTHNAEMRQVSSKKLRPLYEKIVDENLAIEVRLEALEEFRKYIDFSFIHISQEDLDKVLDIAKNFQKMGVLGEVNQLDYRITRQIEETMWKTKFLKMPQGHRDKLFHGVRVFERLYRNKFRNSERSAFAQNQNEAAYNHILRSIDIVLGLVHSGEVNEDLLTGPFREILSQLDLQNPDNLLELCLTVLAHDVVEDELKSADGKSVNAVWMRNVLGGGGLDPAMVERVVRRSELMNARVCLGDEMADPNFDDGRPSYKAYLERLENTDDPYILMAKFGDIFQNSCSSHGKQLEVDEKNGILPQFSLNYLKKHISATVDFLKPYCDGFKLLLGQKVKDKVKTKNPQLEYLSGFWKKILGTPEDEVMTSTAERVLEMLRPVPRIGLDD